MNAIIFSVLSGVLMMLSSVFIRKKSMIRKVAIVAIALLFVVNVLDTYGFSVPVTSLSMLSFERFGLYFNTLVIALTLLFFLISNREISEVGSHEAEYYALIFFSLSGAFILSSYTSLLTLFLGIEIMTIPVFVLTGANKFDLKGNEAALKYFLTGTFSTAILLLGIAFIYGATGNFNIEKPDVMGMPIISGTPILLPLGLLFVFFSMAFKVSAAPFHFWTPDVYDGAPTVFTSYMATIVKAAGFVAFIRLFASRSTDLGASWNLLLPIVIILTLLVGNISAVMQQSVKRMMAYSSIAQAGFMLFALFGNNTLAHEGILLYIVSYGLATIGIFSVIAKAEDQSFAGFNGLAHKHPVIALTTTVCLLSLSGIPLTVGFFGKYYMLENVLYVGGSSFLWLAVVAVLFAAVSISYYFRLIQAMYFKEGSPELGSFGMKFQLLSVLIAVLLILFGIFPSLLLNGLYF